MPFNLIVFLLLATTAIAAATPSTEVPIPIAAYQKGLQQVKFDAFLCGNGKPMTKWFSGSSRKGTGQGWHGIDFEKTHGISRESRHPRAHYWLFLTRKMSKQAERVPEF